jgi:collagen type III alpha
MATQVSEKFATKHDSFIATQLTRAEYRIRFLDLMTALGVLLAGTLAFAIGMILLDRQFVLSAGSRQMALLLYLIAAGVYAWFGVIRPLTWRVNPYYAARQLEGNLPENRNRLINWIDLHDQKHLPSVFRTALGQRAARDLSNTDLEQAISNRRALFVGALAGLLMGLFIALFLWIGPAPFRSLLARAFTPFSTTGGIATRTQVSIVRPEGGDTVVTIGHPVTIVAQIEGRIPQPHHRDAPCLLYRHDPSEPYRQRYLQGDDTQREWATTISPLDVGNGFYYKVTAGDGETPEYRVRVRAAPLIGDFLATYHYRPYTQKATRSRTQRKLEDVRGTRVEILARTNRTLRDGRLDLERADGVVDFLRAELRLDDPQALRFTVPLEQPGKYRIRFTSTEGETYLDSVAHEVAVLPDLPPQVRLTKPGKDIELPVNGHVALEGEASDDFGIARLLLKVRIVDGPTLASKPYLANKLGSPAIGTPRTLEYRDLLELPSLTDEQGRPADLKPGMVLEYWLEATDACDVPRPNVTVSEPRFKIKLTEAADQQEQQRKNEQARQQQKQNEEQQQEQLQNQQAEREEQRRQEEQQEQADNRQREQQRQDGAKGDNQDQGKQGDRDNKENKADKQGDEPEKKDHPKEGEKGGEPGKGGDNQKGDNQKDDNQKDDNQKGDGQKDKSEQTDKNEQQKKDEQTQKTAEELKKALERRDQNKQKNSDPKKGEDKNESKGDTSDNGKQGDNAQPQPGEKKPDSPDKSSYGKTRNKSEQPGKEERPGKGEQPGKEERPGKGEQPGKEERPGKGEQPGKEERPGKGEQPGKEERRGKGEQSGKGEQPGKEERPGKGEQPGKEERPGKGEQPGKEEWPGKGEQPGKEERPGKGEQPGKEERPGKGEQSGDKGEQPGDKGEQPDKSGKGEKGTGSKEPSKSDTNDRPGEGRDQNPNPSEGSNTPDQPARPEKPRAARASQLQLEEFRKRVDPDVLRDAKMSKEQFEQFLRDYADLVARQQKEAEQPEMLPMPGQVDGPRSSIGGRAIKPTGKGTSDDLRNLGRPKPPPEYREAHNNFLRLLQGQKPSR